MIQSIWAASWQNQQCGYAPTEDSDQPGHPPSLIRVFAVAWRKLGSLNTHWAHSEDSDQTGRMHPPRLIESSLGAHAILLVLSWGGSCIKWHENVLVCPQSIFYILFKFCFFTDDTFNFQIWIREQKNKILEKYLVRYGNKLNMFHIY